MTSAETKLARKRAANKKYKSTSKGKETNKRYKTGTAGKRANKRYKRGKVYKAARRREYLKNKWKYSLIYDTKRKTVLKNSTPHWVDYDNLECTYNECPKGMTVDHIIPLQNNEVCGLNVPWNLQYLTRSENSIKNNRFDGTYSNEGWRKLLYV